MGDDIVKVVGWQAFFLLELSRHLCCKLELQGGNQMLDKQIVKAHIKGKTKTLLNIDAI
jgi:hypothetical protein